MTGTAGPRWEAAAERLFSLLLFLYMALGACNLTYGRPVISWVMRAAFLLGGGLLLRRAFTWRRYRDTPLLLWAVLLWGSYLLSLAANGRYAGKNALVYLILWTFYFFLLYAQPSDRSARETIRRVRRVSVLVLLWTTALVLVGIGMLAVGYEAHYRDPANADYEVAAGFFSGRLWGAFQDPNLGAVMCCAAIAVCLYWIGENKSPWLSVLLALDAGLMLFTIALSDSRTGMVCLGTLCAVGALWLRPSGRIGRARIAAAPFLVGLAAGGGALAKLVQAVYNRGAAAGAASRVVDRGYRLAADVSNRRLDIWRDGLRIGLRRPLTGTSFTGAVPWAREHMPDAYILTNDLWVFNTFDSELVNTFAAQGVPGLLILLGWFFLAVRLYARNVAAARREHDRALFLLTAVVCVLIVSALFQGTMLYQTTPNTFLFWSAFGALVHILSLYPREKGGTSDEIGTV